MSEEKDKDKLIKELMDENAYYNETVGGYDVGKKVKELEEEVEKLKKKVAELDRRTFGSVKFGGARL